MNYTDILKAVELQNSALTRRQFFRHNAMGLGSVALASMLPSQLFGSGDTGSSLPGMAHFPAKAKRVIYISLLGAPSQFETFDYKPDLQKEARKDMKEFLIASGVRLTTMTSKQAAFPIAPSFVGFKQHGKGGMWISDLLPYTAKMADDICLIKSMYTEAINHEPANQLIYTGSMQSGKASMGSWLSYGLGTLNKDLPTFCVLHAKHTSPSANVQAISNRLWNSAFLPGHHSGVNLRSAGDPVLYLKDAPGLDRNIRRDMLDGLSGLNQKMLDAVGDPEIQTRMEQYEMAYRMQMSVPELTDLSQETDATYALYGETAKTPGSFAACALMARRLAERGVRFTQIFHRGWDVHGNLPNDMKSQCNDIDQGCYGLIQDLKQRGMLDDTLVVCGGEFGRTVYSQGQFTETTYGRDHHPKCFSLWMAGAGVKGGITYGDTDKYSFNISTPDQKVHVSDLHATILERCGMDYHKLKFSYQGLDQKLTGVVEAKVVKDILT